MLCKSRKILLFVFIIFCNTLFAYDTIEVLNQNITLHKAGYFKTDKNLTPEEALAFAKANNLPEPPKQAMCSGFSNDTYWYLFEVSTNSDEPIFLNPRGTSIFHQDLFVFKDDKFVKSYKNGFFVPMEQRDVKIFPVRFKLEQHSNSTTYLLKIESTTPKFLSFSFGTTYELNKSWIATYLIIVSVSAIAISFIIYNFFVYFFTRDTAYFYYCLYMGGLLFANYVSFGHQLLLLGVEGKYIDKLMPLAAIVCLLGLTFFTIHFLNIQQKYKRFKQVLIILNGAVWVLAPLYVLGIAKPLFLGVAQIISLLTIGMGVKRYFDGYKPAMYYLLATGIAMLMSMIWSIMLSGKIPLTIWSANLANFAIIWDAIILSLALAYRIRMLQNEKEQAQKSIALKAKFTTMGETIGNIAHQWRQPLATLGSINAGLEMSLKMYGTVENERLKEAINTNNKIIQYLSTTIDTFQKFFQKKAQGSFELVACVRGALAFMQGQFDALDIKISIYSDGEIVVDGDEDEFMQVLLVVLNNAKDAITKNETTAPQIKIKVTQSTSKAIVSIEDNGGGIGYENIDEIFEPYVSTKGLNGMGIGLFAAKSIIEDRMGGKISAENIKNGARLVIAITKAGNENRI